MAKPSGWQTRRGHRQGARRLPEKKRRRILNRYPQCWLAIPGTCQGKSTQIHHVRPASDFDEYDDLRNIDAEYINGNPQLVGVCAPCHRAETVRQRWSWQRQPERHPGVLPD